MSKKFLFLSISLILSFLLLGVSSVYAQAQPSEEDTVEVESVNVPAESTVTVDVRLKTDRNLGGLTFLLKFRSAEEDTALDVQCDSIHWSDWFWNDPGFLYTGQAASESYVDSTEKEISIYSVWGVFPGADFLPPGDGVIFTIYFTTGTYWDPSVPAKVDSFNIIGPPKTIFEISNEGGDEYIPVFLPGILGNPSWVREIDVPKTYIPERFVLNQNYPNPFNPTTVIRFALPEASWVKVEVFNILGQKITTLVDEYLTAGYKETGWDGTDTRGNSVASGIYFYKINANNFTDIKKMVLLK